MKFLVTLLIALVTFATADAAKVDIYKNAMANKTFTLKYKINEFPIHNIDKDFSQNVSYKMDFFGQAKIKIDTSTITKKEANTGGVIVFNKDDRYFENSHDAYIVKLNIPKIPKSRLGLFPQKDTRTVKAGGEAVLYKDGEEFVFQFDIEEDGSQKYYTRNMWGGKSSKVTATSERWQEYREKYSNPYQQLFRDYNFGNTDLYLALLPILPLDRIIMTPNTPTYNLVGSGNLDGGLTYEDFYGEKNNFHSAIRYYFNGDKMVKIATFNYLKDENRVQLYEKHVIEIEEFLTTADENYLKLPENLKDVTKR